VDEDDDHGWGEVNVSHDDGRMRLLSEMCSTCVFRPEGRGRLFAITNERVRQLIQEALANDRYIVCHSTLPGVPPKGYRPAVCRGFADRYSTNPLRIMGRLGGIVEVDPPPKEE
jgi:hypothetical protein